MLTTKNNSSKDLNGFCSDVLVKPERAYANVSDVALIFSFGYPKYNRICHVINREALLGRIFCFLFSVNKLVNLAEHGFSSERRKSLPLCH